MDESGFNIFLFFKHFFLCVRVLSIQLHMCAGNASGCDQNFLPVLITEHLPGLSQAARMAEIHISCYLGSWFKMPQSTKGKITFLYITGEDQEENADYSTC